MLSGDKLIGVLSDEPNGIVVVGVNIDGLDRPPLEGVRLGIVAQCVLSCHTFLVGFPPSVHENFGILGQTSEKMAYNVPYLEPGIFQRGRGPMRGPGQRPHETVRTGFQHAQALGEDRGQGGDERGASSQSILFGGEIRVNAAARLFWRVYPSPLLPPANTTA